MEIFKNLEKLLLYNTIPESIQIFKSTFFSLPPVQSSYQAVHGGTHL
jgi:hypothetical protein